VSQMIGRNDEGILLSGGGGEFNLLLEEVG